MRTWSSTWTSNWMKKQTQLTQLWLADNLLRALLEENLPLLVALVEPFQLEGNLQLLMPLNLLLAPLTSLINKLQWDGRIRGRRLKDKWAHQDSRSDQ